MGSIRNVKLCITKAETKELLQKIRESNHIDKLRDYCIVLLMLSTGMRSCSAREARWDDIDFINKRLVVRNNKAQKTHIIPIKEELCHALASYCMATQNTSEIIFLSNKGKPISRTAFNNTIKRVLKYIGIDEQGLSSHIFRHSFVMSMLANKTEPEKIIRFTGHSSVAELEPYIHFNVDDLRDCLQDVA